MESIIVIGGTIEYPAEMKHNRQKGFCYCGVSALAMQEFTPRRLTTRKIKADELRAIGDETCLQSRLNCTDEPTELNITNIKAKGTNRAQVLARTLVL